MELKNIQLGDRFDGFEVVSLTELPEYRAMGVRLRHIVTGCDLFHVANDDEENLFAFAFKTLPRDSKGTPHILEHTVLCGSHRFPLKDPFILLHKGSLNTFLNAFTFPDKTVYPVASTVQKDLFNLLEVYGDAVFFPVLKKEMFQQEGSRLQFNDKGELEVTGVVYNEMKGNYSTHDGIAGDWAYRSLFPDSPYHHDSGGDPASIRELTYEEFTAFHRTYYHPSNALIFLYGNIPTREYARLIEERFLSKFSRLESHIEVLPQPRWSQPRELQVPYPVEPGEDLAAKSSVTVNWLLPAVTDPEFLLSIELLSEILLGDGGAPLEKALIESGLGEDLSPSTGLETELYESVFSVGLRGTDAGKKDEIEKVIFSTLKKLADKGIDPELTEAVLRRIEFRNREIKGSPFGLRLMRKALRGWLHGADPVTTLEFTPHFSRIRENLAANPQLFEQMIDRYLLSNRHRTTLTVVPDPDLQKREQEGLSAWLKVREGALTAADRDTLRNEQAALLAYQQAPDPPEVLESVPFLHVADLPTRVELISSRSAQIGKHVPLMTHEFYTNGIVYIDISIDVSGLPSSLSSMLPLYTTAFRDCGLPGVPYDELSKRISLVLGGFSSSLEASSVHGGGELVKQHVVFRVKMLESHVREALALVREVLLRGDFANTRRVRDLFLELRNDYKASLIPNGHAYVSLRTDRAYSRAERVEEGWRGVTGLLSLTAISAEKDMEMIGARLLELRTALMRLSRFSVNITSSAEFMASGTDLVQEFLSGFPSGSGGDIGSAVIDLPEVPRYESLIVPATVGYVAAAIRGSGLGSPEHAHEVVLAHLLHTGILWEQIRMKGGAYGAYASANGLGEVFTFSSYRDPNIVATLDAYREALTTFARESVDPKTLELGIIGTVGRDLRPYSPGDKGLIGFKRSLYGITDELRQTKRDQILATSAASLKQAAERLLSVYNRGVVAVMSGRDAVKEASRTLPELATNSMDVPV
ncbi:MAG TPA: insulinase family protein [Spirochaetia bacterium]|nr:insulinase family protein [Spirochaetia bacterium]